MLSESSAVINLENPQATIEIRGGIETFESIPQLHLSIFDNLKMSTRSWKSDLQMEKHIDATMRRAEKKRKSFRGFYPKIMMHMSSACNQADETR